VTSPRLIKGGLVQVDVKSGRTLRTIALQYNPDSLSRTMQVQAAGESGGDKSQALRIKGAAAETIKVEAEIDATDRLEHPDQNRTTAELGIHPELAALELLVQPTSEALQGNDSMARSGTLEVLAIEAPLLLFVWGPNRVVPVRITDLSITEDAFDANLNPIRATVSLGMRVLTVDDLGFDHRGGQLFMAHLRSREALAKKSGSAPLSALGVKEL
jgi:Contractile injection system tube protein